MYGEGKSLTLYPYTPAAPHGSPQYAKNPLPHDLPHGWIRGFDPTENVPHNRRAVIKVIQLLSGGDHSRAQILVCSVSCPPSRQEDGRPIPQGLKHIVAKIFDPKFYGADCGSPFATPREQADGNLGREAGAYKYLFEHNMTGGMQLVPEYYGCWATKFVVGNNQDGSPKYRCVGLILMEYIVGGSIEDLCEREDYYEMLVPNEGKMQFGTAEQTDDEKDCLQHDLALRKAVMRMTIRGIVQHLHLGIEHFVISPQNLFVAMGKDPHGNPVPRAVMLDYSLTQVWRKTKYATDPDDFPEHDLELLPHPIHPLERFTVGHLELFQGWYPLAPNKWSKKKQSYCGAKVDSEGEFTKWLIDEFGPLVEGQNDKGEFYSTHETLNGIIEKFLEEKEKKSEEALLDSTES